MTNPFALTDLYPKRAFAELLVPERRGFCFIICPFESRYDPVYRALQQGARDAGLPHAFRADDPSDAGTPILTRIFKGIALAEMVIADVTDANANVFYELGICHMVKDPDQVIIIAENDQIPSDIKFDVCHLGHTGYTRGRRGMEKFERELGASLKRKRTERKSVTKQGQQWP